MLAIVTVCISDKHVCVVGAQRQLRAHVRAGYHDCVYVVHACVWKRRRSSERMFVPAIMTV